MTKNCNKCFLCGGNNLRLSHIIPKSMTNDFRKRSNYRIKEKGKNKLKQDLSKYYLLCNTCEERFSKYEKYFVENVFNKVKRDQDYILIDDNIRYFVLSLLWRVLYECIYQHDLGDLNGDDINLCRHKIEEFKSILFNEDFKSLKNIILSIIPIKWLDESLTKNFPYEDIVKTQVRVSNYAGCFAYCLTSNFIFIINLHRDFIFNSYNVSKKDYIEKKTSLFRIGEIEIILKEIRETYVAKEKSI